MPKDFWTNLYRWLEYASFEDIKHKQYAVQALLGQTHDPGLRTDMRRILRSMEFELLARVELNTLLNRQQHCVLG